MSTGVLNLKKNDILDLTKKNPTLNKVVLAAGWDVVKKGFFSFAQDYDLDLVAILLDANGRIIKDSNGLVYFGDKVGRGIFLHGDNLTGEGDGDDEKISVTLNNLSSECETVLFAVTIYEGKSRKQDFSKVKNAYVRLLDADNNEKEICRYNLTEDGGNSTAILFSEMKRNGGEWQFKAVGQLMQASIRDLLKAYK